MKFKVILTFLGLIYLGVQAQQCFESADKVVKQLPLYNSGQNLCMYSGHIQIVPNKALYYWYFINTNNNTEMPVTIWLNGGPGSSSMTGLFEELGPLEIIQTGQKPENLEIVYRQGSWLEKSNILFIDQPAGTGLSYNYAGIFPKNEDEVSQDFHDFLQKFVQNVHPQTASRQWYITGESYAGKYVPNIAQKILQRNEQPDKYQKINLQGVMIGNPLVFPATQKSANRIQVYEGLGIFDPVLARQFRHREHLCASAISTNATNMTKICSSIQDFVSSQTNGLSISDVSQYGDEPNYKYLYFNNQTAEIKASINASLHLQNKNRSALLLDTTSSVPQTYSSLGNTNDIYGNITIDQLNYVKSQVPLVIYEGVLDTLDGIMPSEVWTRYLNLSEGCLSNEVTGARQSWNINLSPIGNSNGKCIQKGFYKQCSNDNFTLLALWTSGHLVPTQELEASLVAFDSFLNGAQNWCGAGCNCNTSDFIYSFVNNCSNNGIFNQISQTCQCNDGYALADCSEKVQKLLNSSITLNAGDWLFLQYTGDGDTLVNLDYPQDQFISIYMNYFRPATQYDYSIAYLGDQQRAISQKSIFVADQQQIYITFNNLMNTTCSIQLSTNEFQTAQSQFFLGIQGSTGFILTIGVFVFGLLALFSVYYCLYRKFQLLQTGQAGLYENNPNDD